MNLKEATKLFTTKYPNQKILSIYEYDSVYVFSSAPKNSKATSDEGLFDCQTSVNKKTGKIQTFQPWNIPIDEYKRGKKLSVNLA